MWFKLEREGASFHYLLVICGMLATPSKLQYRLASQLSEEEVPLSMRFMHKPARALDEFVKALDPTRENSLLNKSPGELEYKTAFDSKPHGLLVRKKLGEIVKLLLKELLPKSLPVTPSYKQVHFGGDTDVRYFKQKDRPLAISAQNLPTLDCSPGPVYSDGSELEESGEDTSSIHSKNYPQWLLELVNFPIVQYNYQISVALAPVFLERAFVSPDGKYLIGQVAVRNIAFHKCVSVRYTTDNWETIVEVPLVYVPDAPLILRRNYYDRFSFKILLESLPRLFHRQLSNDQEWEYTMCIHYCTPNDEYWDNNNGENYKIRLKRTTSAYTELSRVRPKYSLKFLKRTQSEPALRTLSPNHDAKPVFSHDNTSMDFEKNDFYLLLPLLLNLNNRDMMEVSVLCEERILPKLPAQFPESKSDHLPLQIRPKMDTMAYKELLDSYCFFTPPKTDNEMTDFSAFSSSPTSSEKPTVDSAYTVSSFLKGV